MPDIWPKYPTRGVAPELDRHATKPPSAPRPGPRDTYSLAVDVWREGEHLWRSYAPETAERIEDWAARDLPEGVAWNFDEGRWGVAGLQNVHLWPVPTADSLIPVDTMRDVRDILVTCLAVAQLPFEPEGLDKVPAEPALYMRFSRSDSPTQVVSIYEPTYRVAVRAYLAKVAGIGATQDDEPPATWRASLIRRETRAGVPDVELDEVSATFEAPAKPNQLARAAKEALGLTGWSAARRDKTLRWYLTGAPYLFEIVRVDT